MMLRHGTRGRPWRDVGAGFGEARGRRDCGPRARAWGQPCCVWPRGPEPRSAGAPRSAPRSAPPRARPLRRCGGWGERPVLAPTSRQRRYGEIAVPCESTSVTSGLWYHSRNCQSTRSVTEVCSKDTQTRTHRAFPAVGCLPSLSLEDALAF